MVATPSFIDLLLLDKSFEKELMSNLQTILFCGEKLLKSTINKLYSRFDKLRIINSYGPTECTFAVTSTDINLENIRDEEVPVGFPKKDVKIYIVDEKMNKVPDGDIGEILYIGEIEKKSFFEYNGEKAYATGDLGYIKNNMLYCKGRKDKQIKLKGYRIELTDIEKNLQELEYIYKAVVIKKTNETNKVLNIIAFVSLKENIIKTELEIRQDLLKKIPEYMCPKIKIIKEFPLNSNGKCDEKRLVEEFANGRKNY